MLLRVKKKLKFWRERYTERSAYTIIFTPKCPPPAGSETDSYDGSIWCDMGRRKGTNCSKCLLVCTWKLQYHII